MTRLDVRTAARYADLNPDAAPALAQRSKFNNVKTTVGDLAFDSQAEANYYEQVLLPLVEAGTIIDLVLQPEYELQPAFRARGIKQKIRAITYVADFAFTEDGRQIVVDVKGQETEGFLLKRKMFLFQYQELELRIVDANDYRTRRARGGR